MTRPLVALLLVGALAGCSPQKSVDVKDDIRKNLDAAHLKDVSVSQDRDKGIVTLGGHVMDEAEKARADSMARAIAKDQVVANEIAVLPPGAESQAKTVDTDLDKGIEKNLDAALLQTGLHDGIKYSVKTGVVRLSGAVPSLAKRTQVEKVAAGVPNVVQVVNTLQVKKATSRGGGD